MDGVGNCLFGGERNRYAVFLVDDATTPCADKGLRLPRQSTITTVNNGCRHLR